MKRIKNYIFYPIQKTWKYAADKAYDLNVLLFSRKKSVKRVSGGIKMQKKLDMLFYAAWVTIPIIVMLFGLVVINGNSLLLAFQEYKSDGSSLFCGFDNFARVFNDFITDKDLLGALQRSVILYFSLTLITTVLPVFFSFYIYKKLPGSKFFKTLLFLPSIISGMITVILFRFVADRLVPTLSEKLTGKVIEGLLSNSKTTFNTIFFYSLWMSFGGGLLIQLAAMNTVDESCVESAKIEGIGFLQELWHIVLPASYRVISLNFICSFATLFTNDMGLFAFFGFYADIRIVTIGYQFTVGTRLAETVMYPYYAAWGLITSVIAIPVTLLLRGLIFKYGPRED